MKKISWTLTLTLLTVLFVAPAAMAQPGCPHGPGVNYISHDPNECALIQFICAEGQQKFDNECGCGCIEGSAASLNGAEKIPALDEVSPLVETDHAGQACRDLRTPDSPGSDPCFTESLLGYPSLQDSSNMEE